MPGLGVFRLEFTPFFEGEMTYIWGVTYSLKTGFEFYRGDQFRIGANTYGSITPRYPECRTLPYFL